MSIFSYNILQMEIKINFVLLILMGIVVGMPQLDPLDPYYDYSTFMEQFHRNYTGEERDQHQKIFNENYAELVNRRNNGEDVQVNKYLDWNQTQKAGLFGFQPQGYAITPTPTLKSTFGVTVAAPVSLDYRALGRVTDIKNQNPCGSCWCFATIAQYESLLAIATNGIKYDLAEQYPLQCSSGYGCKGGDPQVALKMIVQSGAPTQAAYPYQKNDDRYYKNAGRPICTDADRVKLSVPITKVSAQTLSIAQLQQTLNDYGPVTIAIYAGHSGFLNVGKSGGIVCPTTIKIDHGVLLVGYNKTHWIIKNSWGTTWGDNGYCYIPKNRDCGVTQYVTVAQVSWNAAPVPSSNNTTPNNTTPNNTTPNNTTPNNTDPNVVNGKISFTINLVDSFGDGWNGNVLGVLQENNFYVFGTYFTSGYSYGPIILPLKSDIPATILVYTMGVSTHEVGLNIKYPNGTVLFNRKPGSTYTAKTVFKYFCPTNACQVNSTANYYLYMTDSYGDGWNDNVLCFKQGNKIITFGQEMTFPTRDKGPLPVTLQRFSSVNITVCKFGKDSDQIGFTLKNTKGQTVAFRNPGVKFFAGTIIGTFCPDCLNLNPTQESVQLQEQNAKLAGEVPTQNSYLISTFVLTGVCTVSIIALIIVSIFFIKERSKNRDQEIPVTINSQKRTETKSEGNDQSGESFASKNMESEI